MARRTTVLTFALSLIGALFVWFGSAPAQAADMDCGDFATQKAAQIFFLNNGGPDSDPHNLDAEGDGIACESNPCPCYYGKTPPGTGGGGGGGTKQVLRQLARVVKVIDGDTIRVRLIGGPRRDVRLIGIDTPEVYGGVECGGPQASKSLKRLLPVGARVRLVSDPTQAYKDRYGRLLRYVMKMSTGKDMNRVQVARGWATVYVFNNKPFQRVKPYRNAQAAAKAAPRGIWKVC